MRTDVIAKSAHCNIQCIRSYFLWSYYCIW